MQNETLLELQGICVTYGNGLQVLHDVDLSIDEGEVVAVMGPNGAGKSTVLKTIFGLTTVTSGKILWHNKPIHPVPHEVVHQGIAFVPQGRRVFTHLTVEENLEIGGWIVRDKKELRRRMHEVMETFPALREKRKAKSGTLSGGQQQMLAVARGLMVDPKILLLDEPTLGLSPKLVKEMFDKIREINVRHHTAIMVVEHNVKSLLTIADRAYVLDKGRVAAKGATHELVQRGVLEKVFVGKPI